MFCPKCGAQLPEGSIFCGKCGMRLPNRGTAGTADGAGAEAAPSYRADTGAADVSGENTAGPAGGSGQSSSGDDGGSGSGKRIAAILGIAAAAVILIVGINLVLSGTISFQSAEERWQEQYDLGQRYLMELDYEQAVVAFTAAIEIDSNIADAYLGRAEAYLEGDMTSASEENLQLALADYDTVLELDDTQTELYLSEAEIYIVLTDYESAAAAYTCAIEGGQQSAEVYISAAEIYILLEDYDNAVEIADEGAQVNPDDEGIAEMVEKAAGLMEEREYMRNLERYAEILDYFYYNIVSGWTEYDDDLHDDCYVSDLDDLDEISDSWWRYYYEDSLSDIGFALIDLDGNGIPELMVGTAGEDEETGCASDGKIYDLYTWQEGEFIHLASSWDRGSYYLCGDGLTVVLESSGAYNLGQYYYYRLSGEKLVIQEAVYCDGDTDPDEPWFYQNGEGSEEEHVTESKAQSVIDSHGKLAYDIILFSDYTPFGEPAEAMDDSMGDVNWAAIYLDMIEESSPDEAGTGSLVYIDHDTIPELVVFTEDEEVTIYTIGPDRTVDSLCVGKMDGTKFAWRNNLVCYTGSEQGMYVQYLYMIEDGVWMQMAYGTYALEGDGVRSDCTWNGESLSAEEYAANLMACTGGHTLRSMSLVSRSFWESVLWTLNYYAEN